MYTPYINQVLDKSKLSRSHTSIHQLYGSRQEIANLLLELIDCCCAGCVAEHCISILSSPTACRMTALRFASVSDSGVVTVLSFSSLRLFQLYTLTADPILVILVKQTRCFALCFQICQCLPYLYCVCASPFLSQCSQIFGKVKLTYIITQFSAFLRFGTNLFS